MFIILSVLIGDNLLLFCQFENSLNKAMSIVIFFKTRLLGK